MSAYLAVTTNTIQFGAELTAEISSGKWSIEGKIGGDALSALPFSFNISIHGGVHVKYRGHSLIGVDFKGGITGPSPIVLSGEVCVSLLFFDACWSETIQLGGGQALPGPLIASLVASSASELVAPANLVAARGGPLGTALAPAATGPTGVTPLVAPAWSQSRVPFGLPIQTFEEGHLDPPQRITVFGIPAAAAELDWFSPGSFVELSEAEETGPAVVRAAPGGGEGHRGRHQVVLGRDAVRGRGDPAARRRRVVGGLSFPEQVLDRLDAIDESGSRCDLGHVGSSSLTPASEWTPPGPTWRRA